MSAQTSISELKIYHQNVYESNGASGQHLTDYMASLMVNLDCQVDGIERPLGD
jgi:hypothetical protein